MRSRVVRGHYASDPKLPVEESGHRSTMTHGCVQLCVHMWCLQLGCGFGSGLPIDGVYVGVGVSPLW